MVNLQLSALRLIQSPAWSYIKKIGAASVFLSVNYKLEAYSVKSIHRRILACELFNDIEV